MEYRKKIEIEYYDKKAEKHIKEGFLERDFKRFNSNLLSSFKLCYEILGKKCQDKIVLDYGCGNGVHSISLAKMGAKKVIGIDLSEKSLKIARERVKREGIEKKVKFLLMDCEKTEFPDNYFDVIFDGGVFSSLDLKNVYPELSRILKPNGYLVGIETFGHNPLANLKRKINKLIGKRTAWAISHILKTEDLERAKDYFDKIEVYYFHLISWLAFFLINFPGGKFVLKSLELVDKILLNLPFLRKYAFKVVFIFSQPKK